MRRAADILEQWGIAPAPSRLKRLVVRHGRKNRTTARAMLVLIRISGDESLHSIAAALRSIARFGDDEAAGWPGDLWDEHPVVVMRIRDLAQIGAGLADVILGDRR